MLKILILVTLLLHRDTELHDHYKPKIGMKRIHYAPKEIYL